MNQNLHVNKTNFHIEGFALGLALKQRRKATWKLPNSGLENTKVKFSLLDQEIVTYFLGH